MFFQPGVFHSETVADGMHFGIATKDPPIVVVLLMAAVFQRIGAFFKGLVPK